MRIWIDLGNSPHVPFFRALAREFEDRGHEVVWTARDYAQTVELARNAGLNAEVFGTHGGKNIAAKAGKFAKRVFDLVRWARGRRIDLVVSHNSQEPLVAARVLGIRSVNLMDYEHHPGNHLSFRAARRVIVPESFPEAALGKFGALKKAKRFAGIKEDVYLSDHATDPEFEGELKALGIMAGNILVVVRPHAPEALYHRGVENRLLDELLDRLAGDENVRIVLLPRKNYQGNELRARHPQRNIIIPERALDGASLVAAADLVISGGGTMNREAAALGVPAYTIFAGTPAAIDQYLIDTGRMKAIRTSEDVVAINARKKAGLSLRGNSAARARVAGLILED
jgi:uncharacterized protein